MLNVAILVLMIIGVVFLGAFLGEALLNAHGGKFFDNKQQLLIASFLIVLGAALPWSSRFIRRELIATTIAAQIFLLAIIFIICGCLDWFWIWQSSRFITLPFALAIGVSMMISLRDKPGQPSDAPAS